MSENLNAIEHLQEAKKLVLQEIASISVVGRALTPEEERRLDVLFRAEENINSAIGHLRGSDENTRVQLPDDGRYTIGNDTLNVEVRIDLGLSNIISGDVFAVADGHREYIVSFRSEPGATLTSQTNPLNIVAEDKDGKRSRGELHVSSVSGTEITVLLTFESQIKGLPINQGVTLAGRYVETNMRELGIEIETEMDTDPLPSWEFNGRTMTLETSLENAGIEVFNVGRRSLIPSPSSGKWDNSQLHGLMSQFAQEPLDRKSWNLHLLMLQESTMNGLLGILFDSGSRDVNKLPRQGVAVFQKPIKQRPDWQRKLIQTTVHELGHALNLAHRFERAVGRADSNSFMNYDWKYLGGNNAGKFWRDFAFTFDPDELAFLRHGPWGKIVPGGAEFHTIPYWENTDGGYVPYIPEIPSDDFRIKISPPQIGALFQFGQSVFLTVELTNNTGRTMELPKFILDPKAGLLEFVVKRRTSPAGGGDSSQAYVFRPIMQRCYDIDLAAADLVPQGGKLVENVNLTFGSAGFTFAEPGDYEVTAVFTWEKSLRVYRTIKSNTLPIRIAYPKTDEEERDGLELFRWDVGYYIALGGSDVLSDAEDVLNAIVDRRQGKAKTVTDPLVANIMRCKAINQTRDFILYSNGKFKTRSANPEKAKEIFASISQVMPNVFDAETCSSTSKLAGEVKKKVKK